MDARYDVRDLDSILSPSLLFYSEIMDANIQRAVELCEGDPSRLRPHVKTHKTPEIVRRELAVGITKHKCATLREAQMLAEAGAPDVLIAYQMVGPNAEALAGLIAEHPGTAFKSVVDDLGAAEALGAAMQGAGQTADVMVDLDVGMHRTGIAADDSALDLYRALTKIQGLNAIGLHAYDGHNRASDVDERNRACDGILAIVRGLRDQLASEGIDASLIVIGGTPPFPYYAQQEGVEASPGTFVLHDCGYGESLPDLGFTPAAILFSRVISKPLPHLACIDLGHKAIAADPVGDRGQVLNVPGAKVGGQSEEHWVLELTDESTHSSLRVGDAVFVCPAHICPTVALHKSAHVVEGGSVTAEWGVTARDRLG